MKMLLKFLFRPAQRWLFVFLASFASLCSAASAYAAEPLRILALGDSYTIGTSVSAAERWPNLLATELRQQGLSVAEPQIIARNGWTVGNLSSSVRRHQFEKPYDYVSLMIGVNDQYQGRSLAQFPSGLTQLVQQAIRLAGNQPERVLMLSIPDWSVSPFGRDIAAQVSPAIKSFNGVSALVAGHAQVQWVDISDLVERARNSERYIADDGLHFSVHMHQLWAERVAQRLLAHESAAAGVELAHPLEGGPAEVTAQ